MQKIYRQTDIQTETDEQSDIWTDTHMNELRVTMTIFFQINTNFGMHNLSLLKPIKMMHKKPFSCKNNCLPASIEFHCLLLTLQTAWI